MTLRVPALDGVRCAKCGAENIPPRKVYVWQVSDERGLHFECDQCSTAFPFYEVDPIPGGSQW